MKGPTLLQVYYEIVKIHWRSLEIFFLRTAGSISNIPATVHPWVKGIQVCSNEDPLSSHKVDNELFLLLINIVIIICVYWDEQFSQVSVVVHWPLVVTTDVESVLRWIVVHVYQKFLDRGVGQQKNWGW